MCAMVKTLLALPIIGLVSIPLLFSAWVTISFALFTLFIRLAVVYVALGYALLANIFALPTSSSPLLTFAPTEPSTPITGLSRRNSSYGLIQSRRKDDSLSSWAFSTAHGDPANRNKRTYARSMAEAHNLPSTPFTGLPISGDERRDFEGVGGWRSYFDSSRWHRPHTGNEKEKPLSSASSSSAASITGEADMDADERAWLSLNQRLELPSQVITLGSNTTSRVTSPTSPRLGNYFHALGPATASRFHQAHLQQRPRHHQRSHTTSSLPTTNRRVGAGLSLALSTRPDQTFTHPVSPPASRLAPFMTPQPYLHTQTRQPTRTLPASNVSHQNGLFLTSGDDPDPGPLESSNGGNFGNDSGGGGGGGGGGGYFALQRPGSYYMPPQSGTGSRSGSGYTTPGTGTSNEERDTSSQLARLMAHYPTSVRHRRRSVSEDAFGERG